MFMLLNGSVKLTPLHLLKMLEVALFLLLIVATGVFLRDLMSPAGPAQTLQQGSQYLAREQAPEQFSSEAPMAVQRLFADASSENGALDKQVPIRETRLDLELKGILLQRGTDKRLALIMSANKEEKVYRVGDEVGNAEIVAIDTRRVVLRHNGGQEALSLRLEQLKRSQSRGRQNAGNNRVSGDIEFDIKVEKQNLYSKLNNLPELLKQASAAPYTENDEQTGFRLVDIRKGSVFQELGLKRDDVLRSVNGLDLHSTKDALWAYQKLKKAENFQVAIMRNGREVMINYSIQ